jgi:hypothetical protein
LWNGSFFGAPQLKRDSLGGGNVGAHRGKVRLIIVAAVILPNAAANAQNWHAVSANLGVAFPADTTSLETTFRFTCSTYYSGTCFDAAFGFDWRHDVYDLIDADLGYSLAVKHRASLAVRAGISTWIRNDRTGALGLNGGIALRGLIRPTTALRADLNWRRFALRWNQSPWFTWPSLTIGLEAEWPPSN